MTPLDVLRSFVIDATCDLPENDYAPEYAALADVEKLVEAAYRVDDTSGAEGLGALAEAIVPFFRDTE